MHPGLNHGLPGLDRTLALCQCLAVLVHPKKHLTVALSSTASEYMAITEGATEAVSLRRLLSEIHMQDMHIPTMIYGDN